MNLDIENNIDIILSNQNFLEKIKEKYPEIKIYLDNLKDTFSSENRQYIINYLNEKNSFPEDNIFLNNILEEIKNMQSILGSSGGGIVLNGEIVDINNPELYKIYKVDKTPEAWQSFVKDIRSKMLFSSFSVVDKGDYLEVYFI